jgi:23S rRNA (cytosine1962-C5)-methyltransferase
VDTSVVEHGVRYASTCCVNQDAGFYLDTRLLRRWLIDHAEGKTVLNTFAYTGSLGVAARAGGAARVLHTDLNARFLEVAKASTPSTASSSTQGLPGAGLLLDRARAEAARRALRHRRPRPAVLLHHAAGRARPQPDTSRLINKVRPLVRGGGRLVVVNNALYLSGAAFLAELEALCAGGWMTIEELIGVPPDVTGYPDTRVGAPPVDPAPFDHTTKIAVLGVRHR